MNFAKLLLICTLLLAACTPLQPGDTAPSAPISPLRPESSSENPLAGTQWTLTAFGKAGAETPVVGEKPITLEFTSDGQATGNGGCNSYGGTYQAQHSALSFGEMVSTLVACVDSALMDQETRYFTALQTVDEFVLTEDELTIYYDGGQGMLHFVKSEAASAPSPTVGAEQEETPPSATSTPEPEAAADPLVSAGVSQDFVWHCFGCGGNQLWAFENGQATLVEIPINIGVYYDYAPATDRILYGTLFPTQGGGPGQLSVTDLWAYNVKSEQAEPIFQEEVIVEAEWAPDGEHLVYVLATDTTYELRWRTPEGEDKLLASDAAFTFSVSPTGEQVAFTRESNYKVGGQPGLYVVDIASGEETMLSDFDRAGTGSIEDKPVWSPDGSHILLSTFGVQPEPELLRATVDQSLEDRETIPLAFDSSLSDEEWYGAVPHSALWIEETKILGNALLYGQESPMGGEPVVILYELNETLDTIVSGAIVAEGVMVGWDVPGSSIWVQVEADMQSVPLPAL
ncbi:MAG: META domain-containing protein [Caldilineaceae bacterium]|nr:META domain-containing protein [Caldilineaceae bacterium]